jgi:hypothetical protein
VSPVSTLWHCAGPLLYGFHVAPLERGRWNPRKRYGLQPCARAGWRRDIGPVERVSSVTSGPVWPSPPLCHHPGHCSTIPDAVGARDDKTPPHPLLYVLLPPMSCTLESAYGWQPNEEFPHSHPQSRSWTGTGLATTPGGSKIRQDDHQLHSAVHHTAIRSFRTVRHDCKLPPLGL